MAERKEVVCKLGKWATASEQSTAVDVVSFSSCVEVKGAGSPRACKKSPIAAAVVRSQIGAERGTRKSQAPANSRQIVARDGVSSIARLRVCLLKAGATERSARHWPASCTSMTLFFAAAAPGRTKTRLRSARARVAKLARSPVPNTVASRTTCQSRPEQRVVSSPASLDSAYAVDGPTPAVSVGGGRSMRLAQSYTAIELT